MIKVSVSIPAYNYANYLPEAIDSILAQTLKDWELVVVDDGSTDNTKEVVYRYIKKYGDKIRYVYQENRGLAGARNTGILNTLGEYIAFLDADDIWMPTKLERESHFLDTHHEVGAVYSDWEFFGSKKEGHTIGSVEYPFTRGWVLKKFFIKCPVSYSSIMIRRICFDKVGLFDETLKQCEDVDISLRIARYFQIDFIKEPLSGYRYHEKNMHLEIIENCEEFVKVLSKCMEDNRKELSDEDYKEMLTYYQRSIRAIGIAHVQVGEYKQGRKYLWKYWKAHPVNLMNIVIWALTLLPVRITINILSRIRRSLGLKEISIFKGKKEQ